MQYPANRRVWDVARECGMKSRDVIADLANLGVKVNSASATIEPFLAQTYIARVKARTAVSLSK